MARSFHALMGADKSCDHLFMYETSWCFRPYILAAIRATVSFYVFVSTFFMFGWRGVHGRTVENERSFSYFTNLTYWGLAFYFLSAAVHTFGYAATGRALFFDKLPRSFRTMHYLLHTTAMVFPPLVVIVYWPLLYKGTWFSSEFDSWSNISQHIFPGFFSVMELTYGNTPAPPWLHFAFVTVILLLYVGLAYVSHATQGFYPYPFLDPGEDGEHSRRVAAYIFGVFGIALGLMLFMKFLIPCRQRRTSHKVKYATPRQQETPNNMELGVIDPK